MKFYAGCVAAGLVLFAAGAQAQMLAPYMPVSDFGGPGAAATEVPGRTTAMVQATATAQATEMVQGCCRPKKSTLCCARTGSRRSAFPGSAASSTRST